MRAMILSGKNLSQDSNTVFTYVANIESVTLMNFLKNAKGDNTQHNKLS